MNTTAAIRCVRKADAAERTIECLRAIQEENQRCARIVASVLDFARQDEGELVPHELVAVARRAAAIVQRRFPDRQQAIEVRVEAAEIWVAMNPTQIEQALVNLLANAMQASAGGGDVSLRIEPDGDHVRLVVADRGRGITPEQMKHVFDPFFTTRQGEGGGGLGLSLVHSTVSRHGGTIDIQSEPKEGTTVTIRLKRLPRDSSPP
jgi:signal transduction histidine kinase